MDPNDPIHFNLHLPDKWNMEYVGTQRYPDIHSEGVGEAGNSVLSVLSLLVITILL